MREYEKNGKGRRKGGGIVATIRKEVKEKRTRELRQEALML